MKDIKDIKDYLHLYFKCWCTLENLHSCMVENNYEEGQYALNGEILHHAYMNNCVVKPHLRPLLDMTVDEFKEYSQPKSFAEYDGYWYACDEEIDPEFEGNVMEHIHESCDNDPENIIMLHIRSKAISYGWISYDEMYHVFGTKENADWFRFLLSKGFDLFGLIDAGLAIDKTTIK